MPAYTCPSLPEGISASGLRAVGVDVGSDLNVAPAELAAAMDSDTLAAVVPHMYGCPARIEEMENACRAKGVYLIDDAAQVVGVATGGRQLGSFGDYGIVSFAQSKAVVAGLSGAGGMLLVNVPSLVNDISPVILALPRPAKRLRAYVQFAGEYLLDPVSYEMSYYFSHALRLAGLASDSSARTPGQISNFEAGIALQQLDRLDAVVSEKVRAAALYYKHLGAAPGFAFPQFAPSRFLSRFMLRVPPGIAAEHVREKLKARRIHTRLGYPTFASTRPIGNALAASAALIEAPFHRDIDEASVQEFCQALAEVSR